MSKNKNERGTLKFVEKMNNKYGEKYSLMSEYTNANEFVTLKCNIHDIEFSQKPVVFLRGHSGCEKCSGKKKWTVESFIEESNKIHENKYSYDKITSVNTVDKIPIVCPIHGEFKMLLHSHLTGQGCPKCKSHKPKMTTKKFIEKAKSKHGDKYDYSKVEYVSSKDKIVITCPKHGDFDQVAAKHLSGAGCQECYSDKKKTLHTFSKEEVIERFKKVHGDKYDYSKVDYKNMLTKVTIVCPNHGDFEQVPGDHAGGHGCVNCTSSISNEENDFFNELDLKDVIRNSMSIIKPMQLDGYIPDKRVGLEYCGIYYHSAAFVDKNYHLNKLQKCRLENIRLIQVFSDEWLTKRDIVVSRIKSILGMYENVVYARKTEFKKVNHTEAKCFLEENHLQGSVNSSQYYGLYYKDILVSLMSFNKPRNGIGGKKFDYEMSRYCVKKGYNIIGGANKLLSNFGILNKGVSVVTYADLRWSEGEIYTRMGFKKERETKPNYSYIVGKIRVSRLNFTKSKLLKEGYDISKTEEEIMLERGIQKIYDCGVITYSKNF